jgi:hypothetical protein
MTDTPRTNKAAYQLERELNAAKAENEAMREVIREVITAINRLTAATTEDMQYAKAKQDAIRFGIATLSKLHPFITNVSQPSEEHNKA